MANELIFVVVDEQPSIRRIVSRFLKEMVLNDEIHPFHKIYEAQNAASALELLEAIHNQLIVGENDVSIPFNSSEVIIILEVEPEDSNSNMSAVELIQACMQHDIFCEFSFIMMFDDPTLDTISEICELGVTDILVKPLTFNNLSRIVRKVQDKIISKEHESYRTAERLIENKEFQKALDIIAESELRFPGLKWVILRGRAHLGLSDTKQAEYDLCSAKISAHIASVIALRHLVDVYEVTGDTEKSIETLNELTQKSPNNLNRRLKLAELLTDADRRTEAKEVLDSLAKMNLDFETQTVVANVLEKSGYGQEAANLRTKSIRQNLDDYLLCNKLAIELRKQGDHEKAESCYQEIIAVHPDQHIIWFNRGVNFGTWGNSRRDLFLLEKARDCFRTALKIDPKYVAAIDMLEALQEQMRKLIKKNRGQPK
jgi:tetratricopeptide (TPR) repeat protein